MAVATGASSITPRLAWLDLAGFRSIERQRVEFGERTLLIGANGAGKSNLIDFLRMLGFMLGSENGLATFVGRFGPASALLHDGPKRTQAIEAHCCITTRQGANEYHFRLGYASGDTLIFLEEAWRFSRTERAARWIELGAGHRSPALLQPNIAANTTTQRTILGLLRRVQVYQFHDTSREARIKQQWSQSDNQYLRSDAANLAPFIDDFVLEPQEGRVGLRWRELGSDIEFGADQASDGTLRGFCLVTLLLQPPETMPPILVIDEPELGLHPFALHTIAGLVKAASVSRQCILATQSPQLLDEFDPEDVLVAERSDRASRFRRLSPEALRKWLDDYTLSDLWNMNVLGGRPGRAAAE